MGRGTGNNYGSWFMATYGSGLTVPGHLWFMVLGSWSFMVHGSWLMIKYYGVQ